MSDQSPVVILGAGVNGCAVARELVLNGVPVTIVDQADIATGATAKSSRLIHGGVRYLEYGDFHLVSESLAERERQLEQAPQFVTPLRLHIPIRRRLGGLVQSVFRFLKLTRFPVGRWLSSKLSLYSERGLYVVRMGLWMYDWIARSSILPGHTVQRLGEGDSPLVDSGKYHWVCTYSDAQMLYPERFIIALLQETRQHAVAHGLPFEVLTYHTPTRDGRTLTLTPNDRSESPQVSVTVEPSVLINATGAWGDETLAELNIDTKQLLGGTKGSHIITEHPQLRAAIGDGGIYAEAGDGRLVFILPFEQATLVGTTDVRITVSPGEVVASEDEVQYLIDQTNAVFEDLGLTRDDVRSHYCGVRPLPHIPSGKTGAIPRGHSVHTTYVEEMPIHTLIGGKLTTWRAFGEEVADNVMKRLGKQRITTTTDRKILGGEDFPADPSAWCLSVSAECGVPVETVSFLFPLLGTETRELLQSAAESDSTPLATLPISATIVQEIIRREWVQHLSDLVERRLALVFRGQLTTETLETLADQLIEAGRLDPSQRQQDIEACRKSLEHRYGITVNGQ